MKTPIKSFFALTIILLTDNALKKKLDYVESNCCLKLQLNAQAWN